MKTVLRACSWALFLGLWLAPIEAQSISSATKVQGRPGLANRQLVPPADPCAKPQIPPQGFDQLHDYDNYILYSDDYLTLGDLTWPDAQTPPCGWPLIILVHGLPGSRINQRSVANDLASQGFAVWAYEVRGQAEAVPLNPTGTGFDWYGANMKFDMAEQIYFVRNEFAGTVSQSKLGVTGRSQGGVHSWFAAAYSGRTITVAGRGSIGFPRVLAVAPIDFHAESHEHLVRSESLFEVVHVRRIFRENGLNLTKDPAYIAAAQSAFLTQDANGLSNFWQSQTDRTWGQLFANLSVPVLWAQAHYDHVSAVEPGLKYLELVPASTPVRSIISTNGHNSPGNDYEDDLRRDLRLRWFDRFLYGEQNQVENEASLNMTPIPLDPAVLNDPSSVWGQRYDDARVEPEDLTYSRRFLSSSLTLDPTVPPAGPQLELIHDVPADFNALSWSAVPNLSVPEVLAQVPLSEHIYSTAPFVEQTELGGRVYISMSVVPDQSRFQISATLEAMLPGAEPVLLSAWAQGVTDATPNQSMRVSFTMPPAATVLPAGAVLRLRIRNHWITTPPMGKELVTVPYFQASNTALNHGPGNQVSFIDLPIRRDVRVALKTPIVEMDSAKPTDIVLEVDGGVARAGQFYSILFGTSGQYPGLQMSGVQIPMNSDQTTAILRLLISAGVPGLSNFSGFLDTEGKAIAIIDWSEVPALLSLVTGKRITFAAFVGSGQQNWVSNPTDVRVN